MNIKIDSKFLKSYFPESVLSKNLEKSVSKENFYTIKKGAGSGISWMGRFYLLK